MAFACLASFGDCLQLYIIEPGFGSNLNGMKEGFQIIPMPNFDTLVRETSEEVGLRYALRILTEEIPQLDRYETILIAGSRGSNILLESISNNIWIGPCIFVSPILNGGTNFGEDNYDDMIRILVNKGIDFLISTGTTTDEQLLIHEPVTEALVSNNISLLYLQQLNGDHDWVYETDNFLKVINMFYHAYPEYIQREEEEVDL